MSVLLDNDDVIYLIHNYMCDNDINQSEFAKLCGVSSAMISAIMCNKKRVGKCVFDILGIERIVCYRVKS